MTHSVIGLNVPPTFNEGDHLIDVVGERRREEFRVARFHRTRDDSTVRTQLVPAAPEERAPVFRASTDAGSRYFHPTFGSTDLHAHGPGGDWAFTITDRYEVVRYDARGDTRLVIERPVEGPRLSEAEEARAEERLREITEKTESSRGEIPFGVPARRSPSPVQLVRSERAPLGAAVGWWQTQPRWSRQTCTASRDDGSTRCAGPRH